MRKFTVYTVTNKVNGKQYVGITCTPLWLRWKNHKSPTSSCVALKGAITKYGREAFSVQAVASALGDENAGAVERLLIAELGTVAPGGYNLLAGGGHINSFRHTDETKAKISAARKGRKASDEARARMRESALKRPREVIERMAETKRGSKASEATRAKMSAAQKAAWARRKGQV